MAALLPEAGDKIAFAIAPREAIEAEILRLHGPALAQAARDRCPEAYSCRGLATVLRPGALRAGVLALVLAGALAPVATFLVLLAWVGLMTACTMGLRAYALALSFRGPARPDHLPIPRLPVPRLPSGAAAAPGDLPVISLLIPLLHEDVTVSQLLAALRASDYPNELLDVIFVLEADDLVTPVALASLKLPPWVRVLSAPPDTLKTKPRALNFALDFCRGSIVGIYDAEDRPERSQLSRIVAGFQAAGPEVGALQGYLDFYNGRQELPRPLLRHRICDLVPGPVARRAAVGHACAPGRDNGVLPA